MTAHGVGSSGPSVSRPLSPPGSKPLKTNADDTEARLREAAVQFEAVFVQQMLSAMRQTIPDGGVIDGGQGEELFAGLLDGHMAELMAGQSQSELSEAIYRQLSRGLE